VNQIIYQKRQWIKVLWLTLPLITFAVLAIETQQLNFAQRINSVLLLGLINVMVIAVIGSLQITVDANSLRWQFGLLGWPKWHLDVRDIEHIELCETRWVEGWGIRFTREGMMYNAAGSGAIRITKKDGKKIRLGSAEPQVLYDILSNRMAATR
jgi:hypothetical protein